MNLYITRAKDREPLEYYADSYSGIVRLYSFIDFDKAIETLDSYEKIFEGNENPYRMPNWKIDKYS